MRTPGRCTNLEGCWIGSTQRDVWLSIGEDFSCPNCSSTLMAPPRRSISRNSLKKAATTCVALSMGLAAIGVGVVKLSAVRWDAPRMVAAARTAPGLQASWHTPPCVIETAPVRMASVTPPSPVAAKTPGTLVAAASIKPREPLRVAMDDVAPVRPSSSSVLEFNTPGSLPGGLTTATDTAAPLAVARDDGASPVDDEREAPAASLVTLVSEAPLIVPQDASRAIVMPISFGKPQAPEDDAAPVTMRWRFHGFARTRHSYFLPAPGGPTVGDAVGQISRTPGFLR